MQRHMIYRFRVPLIARPYPEGSRPLALSTHYAAVVEFELDAFVFHSAHRGSIATVN